jgi:hypothetical protein
MLVIKNLSEVNASSYEADFEGFKSPIEDATEQTVIMEVVRA